MQLEQSRLTMREFLTALLAVLRDRPDDWQVSDDQIYIRALGAQLESSLQWVRSLDDGVVVPDVYSILEDAVVCIAREYDRALGRKPLLAESLGTFKFALVHPGDYLDADETVSIRRIDAGLVVFPKREAMMVKPSTREYVRAQKDAIARYEAVVLASESTPSQREAARRAILHHRLWLLIARYSRGEDIASLPNDFPPVVEALAAYLEEPYATPLAFDDLEQYIFSLWMVSLAYLLEVEETLFEQLISLLGRSGRDALFDKLVALRFPDVPVASELLHPVPYLALYQAVTSLPEERDVLILQFLKQYYPSMGGVSWYNVHLADHDQFFGYWCFELAAFVKGLQIDDTAFADNYYYPRDLTGQYLFRTWDASRLGEQDRAKYHQLNPDHEPFMVLHRDSE